MAFWGDDRWLEVQGTTPIVHVFSNARLREGCYRLMLGDEAIVSSSETDNDNAYRKIGENDTLVLKPGNFAYLITEETICIPENAIGLINVSTNIKFKGLVNISGFHADPLYEGKLIFTVFNAGPSSVTLSHKDEVFRLWLSDFLPAATAKPKKGYDRIPRDWADKLQGVYPSPFALAGKVQELEGQVRSIARERNQNRFFLVVLSLLIFPFVAAMYSEVFGPWFHEHILKYL